jgi:hypothetical protein
LTLGELVRQEKFGAGSADQKNLDAEMASAIARDGKYQVSFFTLISCERIKLMMQDDNDYVDDNAEKLARRKMKTDALKRAFAINGQFTVAVLGFEADPQTTRERRRR